MIDRQEILDKIEGIQELAYAINIGSNEEQLQVREEVADLIIELVKSNSVLGGVVVSCNKACSPSDYYEGGKCDKNGCYKK